MNPEKSEIIIYQSDDGKTRIDVRMENETVWLTQAQMVELFQRDQSVISRHIKSAISEGELDPQSNMQFLHIANSDKPVAFYNLDVIISVGYRVKSLRGTQFRRCLPIDVASLSQNTHVTNTKQVYIPGRTSSSPSSGRPKTRAGCRLILSVFYLATSLPWAS